MALFSRSLKVLAQTAVKSARSSVFAKSAALAIRPSVCWFSAESEAQVQPPNHSVVESHHDNGNDSASSSTEIAGHAASEPLAAVQPALPSRPSKYDLMHNLRPQVPWVLHEFVGNGDLNGATNAYVKRSTPVEWNALMMAFAAGGKVDVCRAILAKMKQKQVEISSETYEHLLLAQCVSHDVSGLYITIRQIRSAKPLVVTGLARLRIFHMFAEMGDAMGAVKMLEYLRRNGFGVTASNWAELIRMFSKKGKVKGALDLFLAAEAHHSHTKQPVSPLVYNAFLTAFMQSGDQDAMKALLDEMRLSGSKPDSETYAIIIQSHGKIEDDEECIATVMNTVDVCEMLSDKGDMVLDAPLYDSAMFVCSKRGQHEKALELNERMHKRGVPPNQSSFHHTIHSLVYLKRFSEVEAVYQAMLAAGLTPNIYTFKAMLHYLTWSKQSGKFKQLLAEMNQYLVKPDEKMWMEMFKELSNHKDIAGVMECLGEMASRQVRPTYRTRNFIVRPFLKLAMHDQARIVLQSLADSGVAVTEEEFNFVDKTRQEYALTRGTQSRRHIKDSVASSSSSSPAAESQQQQQDGAAQAAENKNDGSESQQEVKSSSAAI